MRLIPLAKLFPCHQMRWQGNLLERLGRLVSHLCVLCSTRNNIHEPMDHRVDQGVPVGAKRPQGGGGGGSHARHGVVVEGVGDG